jgi:hypothetical protein
MATIGGNNSVRDGLVFYYDTGNKYRSFKGEPVTNLYGDIGTSLSMRPSRTEFNHGNLDIPSPPEKIGKIFKHTSGALTSEWSGNSYGYTMKDFTVPYDTTYVVSCWIYLTEDCNLDSFAVSLERETPVNTTNVTYDLTKKGTWQRVWQSGFVPSATPNQLRALVYPAKYGVIDGSFSGAYYWGGMQVHEGTYPVPYTPNTRTTTESLLDMTGNYPLNTTNLIFDVNGQPYFDGSTTGSFLNTGFGTGLDLSTNPITLEAIVKIDDLTGNAKMWVDANGNGTNQRLYGAVGDFAMGIQGDTWGGTLDPHTDYTHQVITLDGTNAIKYTNGVPTITKTYTPYSIVGPIMFGGRNGYIFHGPIPVAKIYNKALTPDEVKHNFNSYKGRFNL